MEDNFSKEDVLNTARKNGLSKLRDINGVMYVATKEGSIVSFSKGMVLSLVSMVGVLSILLFYPIAIFSIGLFESEAMPSNMVIFLGMVIVIIPTVYIIYKIEISSKFYDVGEDLKGITNLDEVKINS